MYRKQKKQKETWGYMLTLEQTTLGHYRLLHRLRRGGMSEVYLAHDEQGDRDVAIKVVNNHYVDLVERLQREAQAIRALTHKREAELAERISILPILDYGEEGSWHYLVMPYMKHDNLRAKLAKGRLSLEEAGMILEQFASALQFAHDHGILHRDIKPSNILLGDEQRVYLADFGLAKAIDQQEKDITQTGCLIGTPEYMAPELAEEPFSTSCDIYALGVLLYQMVTGQVPFKGSTPLSVYWKHIQEQPVPPSLLNPGIPRPVEEVILRAMEKNPRRRFQTAQELAQAYMQAIHCDPRKSVAVRVLPLAQRWQADTSAVGTRELIRAPLKPLRMVAAVILLVFLLVSSLSLGVFASQWGAQVKASQLLGASAQLQLIDKTQQENPTPMLGVPPTTSVSEDANDSQLLQGHTQGGPKETKQDHGHKHKHKPSKEDTTTNSDEVAGNGPVLG